MPKLITVSEGQDLVREGQETTSLFYLQKGFLGVFKRRGGQGSCVGTNSAG